MASLSTEPAAGCSFLISVFDIPEELLPSFHEREEEFRIISAPFVEVDGSPGGEVGMPPYMELQGPVSVTTNICCFPTDRQALMCTRWTDAEYIQHRFDCCCWRSMFMCISALTGVFDGCAVGSRPLTTNTRAMASKASGDGMLRAAFFRAGYESLRETACSCLLDDRCCHT